VIKTNQKGFSQPPNHISTAQVSELVTTTTNEHHPHLKGTNNKQNLHINPYQPLFLPTMPLPLQQPNGMPTSAPTLHLPFLPTKDATTCTNFAILITTRYANGTTIPTFNNHISTTNIKHLTS